MIETPSWPVSRHEESRNLTLPSLTSLEIGLNISHRENRRAPRELEVAASLQHLKSSAPRYAPPPPAEWVSVKPPSGLHQSHRLRPSTSSEWVKVKPDRNTQPHRLALPSFGDGFGDAINRADRPSLRSARSSIAESEWSLVGAPSPASTATLYGSPAMSPATPSYHFTPTTTTTHQLYPPPPAEPRALPYHHKEDSAARLKRKALRRVTSRATIHGSGYDQSHPQQQARPAALGGSGAVAKQPRRPASAPNLKSSGGGGPKNTRHFNQKYKNPDKLFLVYCKEDLKMGWSDIQQRRLALLTHILGTDYDPQVEPERQVNGINGRYYRENEVMPLLTADGSGLVFRQKEAGGRWWECVQSQKCRVEERGGGDVEASSSAGGRRKGGAGATDTRPRGMVERYPEEVLLYWDSHMRFLVPEERRAEVFARATRYARIRGEQRQLYGVPAWSLDNADDRVLNLNPPKDAEKTEGSNTASAAKGRAAPRRRNKS